jgi:hypothetical protein
MLTPDQDFFSIPDPTVTKEEGKNKLVDFEQVQKKIVVN